MSIINLPSTLTIEQQFMLARMTEHSRKRMEGWTVNLINEWFPITRLDKPTILGSFAWTQTSTQTKWLMSANAVHNGASWVTPADLARDYLSLKFPDRKPRISTRQYQQVVSVKRFAPLAALPGDYDAVYLDLLSAYWSILQVVGWDVEYSPGRYLATKTMVHDYPWSSVKLSRNCLVSVGLPGAMRLWTGEKLIFQKKPNKFINLMLFALVMDVLNGIAHDMIHNAGAVYVHTDGYIIPLERERDAYEVAKQWGLIVREKGRGQTKVFGVGDYIVGNVETKVHRKVTGKTTYKVKPVELEWLRKSFARLAGRQI